MIGGRVRSPYGRGRHGVVLPRASDIIVISVLPTRLPHHTNGRRHPRSIPPNTASIKEQGDEHCGAKRVKPVRSILTKDVSIY